jgi:hypothetical protein
LTGWEKTNDLDTGTKLQRLKSNRQVEISWLKN